MAWGNHGTAEGRRLAKLTLADRWGQVARAQAAALPPGCKGAACPAFALCQGRCEAQGTPRIAPDGGIWIETL
jgi:hypothetical protein